MDAKRPIKTRLKSNGTKIIGKSSAQKNMHPEVADIVKIILTMRAVLLIRHNNKRHLNCLTVMYLILFSFWSDNILSRLKKCD